MLPTRLLNNTKFMILDHMTLVKILDMNNTFSKQCTQQEKDNLVMAIRVIFDP